jgi:chaperonin GroES
VSLEEKRKLYPKMPAIEYGPMGKNVLIYRIDGDEKTAGGLYVPEENREVKSRGILMAAGLGAMDKLADALIEIGDEVCLARFGGDDREIKRKATEARATILECKVEDILGSVEQPARAESYDIIRSDGEDGYEYGTHYYRPKAEAKTKRRAA